MAICVVICGGCLPPPPLPWASAAAAQLRHCRRRGASYHLRLLGCGLAQRRRDVCPVAPTCWGMHNKHPCNSNSVCCCLSSAILLRAGAPALKQHGIWQTYTVIYQAYDSLKQLSYDWYILVYTTYMPTCLIQWCDRYMTVICRGLVVKASDWPSFDHQFGPYPRAIKAAPLWCGLDAVPNFDGRIHQ